jgi:hypothetical protein
VTRRQTVRDWRDDAAGSLSIQPWNEAAGVGGGRDRLWGFKRVLLDERCCHGVHGPGINQRNVRKRRREGCRAACEGVQVLSLSRVWKKVHEKFASPSTLASCGNETAVTPDVPRGTEDITDAWRSAGCEVRHLFLGQSYGGTGRSAAVDETDAHSHTGASGGSGEALALRGGFAGRIGNSAANKVASRGAMTRAFSSDGNRVAFGYRLPPELSQSGPQHCDHDGPIRPPYS